MPFSFALRLCHRKRLLFLLSLMGNKNLNNSNLKNNKKKEGNLNLNNPYNFKGILPHPHLYSKKNTIIKIS
jgi:hypothetical protein